MYQFISTFNGIIRDEVFPNAFSFISDNPIIVFAFATLIGNRILRKVSYSMCGVFYNKGSCPALGSIGYMSFFALNVWILLKLSEIFNSIIGICIVYVIVMILIYFILNKIKQKMFTI